MNKRQRLWRFAVVYLWFLLFFTLAGGIGLCSGSDPSSEAAAEREDFTSRCPRPHWWNRVDIKKVKIDTYGDLLKYWQNHRRSDSEFFKAAYQSIVNYPLDPDIDVLAIKLMYYTDRTYPQMIALQEYGIERFFDYRGPSNHPADSICGIVENLAHLYNRQGDYEGTVNLIERLLREREEEINDHLLELIHLSYAEALKKLGRKEEAIGVLEKAIRKYNGSWEKRLQETLTRYKGVQEPSGSKVEKVVRTPSSPPMAKVDDKEPSHKEATKERTVQETKEEVQKAKGVVTSHHKKPWWQEKQTLWYGGILLAFLVGKLLKGRSEITAESRSTVRKPFSAGGTIGDVEECIRRGRKIDAIKIYRKLHQTGLKEAKEAVEEITRKMGKG